ncbi:LacI family DNA-binding transcriptional regulator [Glutamicibacter creatinolyticus]|uniref:LacI family DNA-binding transcriptional regulator n=1 Tax=Glutamicibacter creatinolyticus TaxID=162496 RepID=UPI0033EC83AE
MKTSRRTTIGQVAEFAGVSTATVSRVLSGVSPVSETTRVRVLEAIDSLNYRPSDLTRAVFAGRSNTIGVLLADMRNPYYIDLIDGISQIANEAGTLAYLAAGNRNTSTEQRTLSLMDSHRVRGLITTAANDHEKIVHAMAEAGTECVYITQKPKIQHPRMHSIRLDDFAAGQLAWQHLSDIGRTRVLIVNQSRAQPTMQARTLGFFEAAQRSGVTINEHDSIFRLKNLSQPSGELQKCIIERAKSRDINAIFATTGIGTFRAYEALSRSGLRIPQDVAILGLDDFMWAEYLAPSLSVIAQPTIEMGAAAARVILEEPGEALHMTFDPSLVVRDSTSL